MIKKPLKHIAEKIVRDRYFAERRLSEYACRSINGRRFFPEKGAVIFSTEVIEALKEKLIWNKKNIYRNPLKMVQDFKIKKMFNEILEINMNLLKEDKVESKKKKWAKVNGENYINSNSLARIVADYISGMTDDFVLRENKDLVIPKSFGYAFKNRKGD